jgi:hypothetical protein
VFPRFNNPLKPTAVKLLSSVDLNFLCALLFNIFIFKFEDSQSVKLPVQDIKLLLAQISLKILFLPNLNILFFTKNVLKISSSISLY